MNQYIDIDDQMEKRNETSNNLYKEILYNEKFKQRKNQNISVNSLSRSKIQVNKSSKLDSSATSPQPLSIQVSNMYSSI